MKEQRAKAAGERARAGKPDARMVTFVREHGERVSAWLRRYGVGECDLMDARQDVWVAAFRHLDELSDPAAARGWLYTVCRRTAKDLRRRAHRRHERVEERPLQPVDAEQARLLDARARLAAVQRAAEELSPVQRDVFWAHGLGDADTPSLSVRHGCPPKTIFSRLYAARAHLRKRLAEEGWLMGWLDPLRQRWAPGSPSFPSAPLALSLSAVLVTAVVTGAAERTAPARLVGEESAQVGHRRVAYMTPSPATAAEPAPAADVPRLDRAHASAGPVMRFDVLDLVAPRASLALQRTGVLEFEPIVVAPDGPVAVAPAVRVVTHPPDIKPRVLMRRPLRQRPR